MKQLHAVCRPMAPILIDFVLSAPRLVPLGSILTAHVLQKHPQRAQFAPNKKVVHQISSFWGYAQVLKTRHAPTATQHAQVVKAHSQQTVLRAQLR